MSLSVAFRQSWPGTTLDIAFDAPAGLTALFGRSGAGKTSVIRAVAGLSRPEAGRIALGARTLFDAEARIFVPPHRRHVACVFQEPRLFPHLSVRGNLAFGRRRADVAAEDRITAMLGIGPLLNRRTAALSGGEAARVAIGRALLSDPDLLVMDEPLAALDLARREEILPYIERLRDEAGLPILYVSHQLAEVARLATTVVLIEGGRVRQAGPAAGMLADPELAPGLGLREAGAILTGRIAAHHADGLSEIAVAAGRLFLPRLEGQVGERLRVRIAARDVILATQAPQGLSALNILPARIAAIRPGEGPGMLVQLDAGGEMLLARITRRSAEALQLAPGRACHAIAKTVSVAPADIGRTG